MLRKCACTAARRRILQGRRAITGFALLHSLAIKVIPAFIQHNFNALTSQAFIPFQLLQTAFKLILLKTLVAVNKRHAVDFHFEQLQQQDGQKHASFMARRNCSYLLLRCLPYHKPDAFAACQTALVQFLGESASNRKSEQGLKSLKRPADTINVLFNPSRRPQKAVPSSLLSCGL